jgi:hypothetical protein
LTEFERIFSCLLLTEFERIFSCLLFIVCSVSKNYFIFNKGPSWSWSYGSWIYNYLCNQCLSPLKLWVRTPFMAGCTGYNIMW